MTNALQIQRTPKPALSLSQHNLLKIMIECVKTNQPLTFEQLVHCYSESVNHEIYHPQYDYLYGNREKVTNYHNVIEAYKQQSWIWKYKIKGLIKSWFVSAVGLLVIKGKLMVLPIIEIE